MFKVIKRQLKILKDEKVKIVFLYFFLNALAGGLLPIVGVIMPKYILDSLANDNFATSAIQIAALAGISLVLAFTAIFSKLKAENIFIDIRLREFDKLNYKVLRIDYSYFEDEAFVTNTSEFTMTLNNNQDGFEGAYRRLFGLLPLIVTIILSALLLGFFNWYVILGCILGTGLGALSTFLISKYELKMRTKQVAAQRKLGYFNRSTSDFAYGKDIRVYDLKDELGKNIHTKIATYVSVIKDIAKKKYLLAFIELLGILIQDSLAYFFVVRSFFNNEIQNINDVPMYLLAIIALGTSLRTLFNEIVTLRKDTKMTETYFKFLDSKEYVTQQGDRLKLDGLLEIEFKNVSFKYPKTENYIFKNFSFKISKGEKLAVVGLNGCGKTTFIKLICGLFFSEEGEILINGINIREFSAEEYHKMFSVVFQDMYLYAATVLENVIGSDKDAESIERGKKAIEMAGMKEKVESLPNQYNHHLLKIIDETGVDLSGGQIQKLAIARALYKNGNFVILDEPTAALDALAEAQVYESFNSLIGEKTAIYISHRLTSTKFCDKIAYFEDGLVKEYGTHEELMNNKSSYHNLFVTQGKYYQEVTTDDNI